MARAVGFSDYASASWLAVRREASSTINALGLPRLLPAAGLSGDGLDQLPEDFYSADSERGDAICEGRFSFAGDQLIAVEGADIWAMLAPSRTFATRLHGFGWLRHVIAADDHNGAAEAQRLVDNWIAQFGSWNSFAWSHGVLSSRIMNWLRCGDALFGDTGEPDKVRRNRLRALNRQVRYLKRAIGLASDGPVRLRCAVALSLSGLCLPRQSALYKSGLGVLAREVERQILPDGGHVTRSPRATMEALIDLVTLRDAAEYAQLPVPVSLQKAIDRLRPMTRFFEMADGGLAAFHGSGEGDRAALAAALARDEKPVKPFGFAPHSGFHRSEAGGATVIFDVGDAPRGALSTAAHASALSIEMCTPGGRLIVNCGWHDDQAPNWREAVRATAAHSTLVLEEASSARLLPPGWQRNLLGPRLATRPGQVTARRNEGDMGVWLEGAHEGYRTRFGLLHRRRIFLAADGGDLRGEDALSRPVEDGPPEDIERRLRFAIRFHLHPDVRASLSRDSMSALLVQPNGDGWRFRTDGGPLTLERSVYLAAGAPPQRSQQIVIYGDAESYGAGDKPPNRVRWAFQRLGRVGGAGGEAE